MVFDIKMDGKFTRKARFVAGGHTTDTPASITYSSVVSRDSVRIAFLIAALNDLDVWAADIGNAYLNADCREKIYHPELDATPLLGDKLATRYMHLLGVLRWACELGRIDMLAEVSSLASHMCAPREGHLETIYKIFAYLKKHEKSTLVFDDLEIEVDERLFQEVDWADFYDENEEELPPKMPKPRGKAAKIVIFMSTRIMQVMLSLGGHSQELLYL